MTVKTSAQLSRERKEFNGLDAIQEELTTQPRGTRYAVVAYTVKRVSEEIDEGVDIPTVQFVHIEPVRDGHEATAKRILAERYKDRTGKDLDGDPKLFDVVPDDERQVPEASGEEILAEARERREADLNADATRVADEAEAARGGGPDALPVWDDGTCGDCAEGKCHGGDPDDCGCARHAASVEAAQDGGEPA